MALSPNTFDWSLVRSFLAVLDAGSLMGAPLFERTGRGVTPTVLALAVAEAARQMQDGADALARSLARERTVTTGSVRVTASQVAATWLLPELLARLAEQEPGIQIELVASNTLSNLLRREADIAVRMVRPAQSSLVAKKLGEVRIVAAAHERYLARAGVPRKPTDLLAHRLIGYDRDDLVLRGFVRMGFPITREQFALRTDDQVAYGQLVASGAGIGFVASYNLAQWPGVKAVLPMLQIPTLPCWLAVHREIRGSRVVRRVYDFLAESIPAALEAADSKSR
jgi:DNA-binding transcriptional LysR family regulator